MTQLDLVSLSHFMVLEDPKQEEAKMPDLDTAELKEIAQDECLGNTAERALGKAVRKGLSKGRWIGVALDLLDSGQLLS
ncbi:Hypothetical predicted protein [Olea europaea subsp. europaea]|uniref:Uncharacterized protein n=1 Tax=Olea europaea subsp. europaea TaxID=158383 RepID=A0A8S0VND6_OLEEU|nr:Hypothetical predicted protein [Olea europaea subsp. europaea]